MTDLTKIVCRFFQRYLLISLTIVIGGICLQSVPHFDFGFEHDMFLRLMVPPIGKRKSHLNFISIYFYFKSYNYLFFALKLVLVFVNSV